MGKKAFLILFLFSIYLFSFAGSNEDWDFSNGLFMRGMYELAAQEYLSFIKSYPQDKRIPLAYFRLGECYYQLKLYSQAKKAYTRTIELGKEKVEEAWVRLGEIYYRERNYPQSIKILKELLKKRLSSRIRGMTLFFLGKCYYEEENYSHSRRIFEQFIEEIPEHEFLPFAHFYLALSYWKIGDLKASLKELDWVIKNSPSLSLQEDSYFYKGLILFQSGKYSSAREAFHQLRTYFPSSSHICESLYWEAVISYRQGEYSHSLNLIQDLIVKNPEEELLSSALLLKGKCLHALGEFPKAEEVFRKLSSEEAQYWLAKNYLEEGKREKSKGILENLVKKRGEFFSPASYLLGKIYYQEGKYLEALKAFSHIEKESSSSYYPYSLLQRGKILKSLSRYEEAVQVLTSLIEKFPTETIIPQALLLRGEIYSEIGEELKAKEDYNQIVHSFPSHPLAEKALLSSLLLSYKEHHFSEVEKEGERFLRLFPESGLREEVLYYLACSEKEKGDFSSSLKYLKTLKKEFPAGKWYPHALYLEASIYFLKKEEKKAVDTFMKIIFNYPSFSLPMEIYTWVGEILFKEKRYLQAYAVFEELRERYPQNSQELVHYWEGVIEVERGKNEEGIKRLEKFLKEFPSSPLIGKVYYYLGKAKINVGKDSEALWCWEKGSEAGEEGGLRCLYSLGDYYFTRKEYEKAYRYFLKLSLLFDDPELSPSSLYKAGLSLKEMGKEKEAQKVFSELLQRYPESKWAKEVSKTK